MRNSVTDHAGQWRVSKTLVLATSLASVLLPVRRAEAVPFQIGDVFVSVSSGQIQHWDGSGNYIETLDTGEAGFTTGMAFDRAGNLYVTTFVAGGVVRFDNQGTLLGPFGGGYSGQPESLVFDRSGNLYAGAVDGDDDIREFDGLGNLIDQFDAETENRGTDWIDLASDQCTLFYTSESWNIKRYNVCTRTQLPDFNAAPLPDSIAYALRLLPGGDLLVANTSLIARLDPSGVTVQAYDALGEDCWFALNLDPDGKSFWSADFCSATVHRFDIETGIKLLSFNTGTGPDTVFGLVVFGEATVGAPGALRARVGNERVYLDWEPVAGTIEGYNIYVERREGDEFVALGTVNPEGILIQSNSFRVFTFSGGGFPENGRLYRFTVRAVSNGVEGPPSAPVYAVPGEFAVPYKPAHPVLFVHGLGVSEATWEKTADFLLSTLNWRSGGVLRARLGGGIDRVNFDRSGDFFRVAFADPYANYSNCGERCGILRQSDEFGSFLTDLVQGGVSGKLGVVAHSMGGLAGRAWVEAHPRDAVTRIADFITYGTPHQGLDLDLLKEEYFNSQLLASIGCVWGLNFANVDDALTSRGAADMDATCGREASPFLRALQPQNLPAEIRYTALVGHSHWLEQCGLIERQRSCLIGSDGIEHWDGIAPIVSADLAKSTPLPVRLVETGTFHTDQTEDFASILCALDKRCLRVTVRSPVEVEIKAPDGRALARDIAEIPGAAYMDLEDEVGHPVTTAVIPVPQGGDYSIAVHPKPGATPDDTYSLEVTRDGATIILERDQPVENIPSQPYVVTVPCTAERCNVMDDDCNGLVDDQVCRNFDCNDDGVIDGVELAWLGRAFGSCSGDPSAEWWSCVDYDHDGCVEGPDLSILGTVEVWARTTGSCRFTCP